MNANLRKVTLTVLMVMLATIFISIPNSVNAAFRAETMYLGVSKKRGEYGYAISDPNYGGSYIWYLQEFTNSGGNYTLKANGKKDIYCVKAGVGFRLTSDKDQYTKSYDLKTDKASIPSNDKLTPILTGTVPYKENNYSQEVQVSRYYSLLALGDILLLEDASEADKIEYLTKAGIIPRGQDWNDVWDVILSKEQIMAIQQAAIWYFTNYEDGDHYDKTENTGWFYYTSDETSYNAISGLSYGEGEQLRQQAEDKLYKYLIKTAKSKADEYENMVTGAPATIETSSLGYDYTTDEEYYILGPIRINGVENNPTPYEIEFKLKAGESDVNSDEYTLLNSNKEPATGNTIKDLVDQDFYVKVSKNKGRKYSIKVNIKYTAKTWRLYLGATDGQNEQPVIIPEVGTPENEEKNLEVEIKDQEFDLHLVKAIVEVNGDEVSPKRIGEVDVSNLNKKVNGEKQTTADYNLVKDPVPVEQGDIITYVLRVYNEGDIDGYASEISDYIPDGLEFLYSEKTGTELENDPDLTSEEKEAIKFNQDRYWEYDKTDSTLKTIKTEYLSKDNEKSKGDNLIKAFDRAKGYVDTETDKNPDYKEVAVKLRVTADDSTIGDITNIAEITGHTDENGDPPPEDRDSTPKNKDPKEDDEDKEKVVLKEFDLALRKFIIAVSKDEVIEDSEYLREGSNNRGLYKRAPQVDTSKLNTTDADGNKITTAEYNHTKEPLQVENNDIVVYMIRVYNEGNVDGYAAEIKDHLPPYLEFVEGEFNSKYGWEVSNGGRTVTTTYLSGDEFLINKPTKDSGNYVLNYQEVPIMCKVVGAPTEENITNIAEITVYENQKHKSVKDRDSDSQENKVRLPDDDELPDYKGDINESYIPGQQDDDDFEKVFVPEEIFDLALRKFAIAISKDETIEEGDYLRNSDDSYKREPQVDTSKLNTTDADGNKITTAEYNHTKEPLEVQKNDIVVYMIRVYNEGNVDGYAAEVKDHLPEYLEFVDGEFNDKYGWEVSEDGRTVTTTYLSGEEFLIKKATMGDDGKYKLDYKEVPIMCKVVGDSTDGEIINIAEVSKYEDKEHNPTEDRDSGEDNLPKEEDDDDKEKVVIPKEIFDLALRKFIIAVSDDETIDDEEYLKENNSYTREPQVDTSKLNTEDENGNIITNAEYNHTKDPLVVQRNNIIVYMIRVYNEGNVDGYAAEVKDHLPEYLEFVDGEFNDKYGWEVSEDGRTVTTTYLSGEEFLIKKATMGDDGKYKLDYKEVPIMCKVLESATRNEEIINIADISKYEDKEHNPTEDRDSGEDNLPKEEDDDDKEKVVVKKFDLSLKKWVTQTIVTDSTGTKVTDTGNQPYDNPDPIVKVEINRKKLNEVTVKFRYKIRVVNEGDIEGYAKEVTDYVPEGLKFVAEDNPGWTNQGNNVVTTRLLENTLLKPGEFADVEIVLTWEKNENNMGMKTNTAEITEDDNDLNFPDEDSEPNNKNPKEDDQDDAPVLLSVSTGRAKVYFTLGLAILIILGSGIVTIRKFTL